MSYQIIISETVWSEVRQAGAAFLSSVKKKLKTLKTSPDIGKPLMKRLSGYYSLRTHKYRIVYKIIPEKRILEVHYMGLRRDLHEIIGSIKNEGVQR